MPEVFDVPALIRTCYKTGLGTAVPARLGWRPVRSAGCLHCAPCDEASCAYDACSCLAQGSHGPLDVKTSGIAPNGYRVS